MKALSRAELLALPPVTNLATLGRALGISEPVVRERNRRGELADLGIRVLRLGAQWRVVTADVLHVLGIKPDMAAAGPATGPAADASDYPIAAQRGEVGAERTAPA
jgi:hypothetical protein